MRILTALLLTALAWAGGPEFSGTWSLDRDASTSMDPVLSLQGVSWALRKAAANLDAESVITQDAAGMTVQFDNFRGKVDQRMVFDGQPHATVNPGGLPTTSSTSWEGAVLVASGPVDADGVEATLTERRSLSADGATMTVQVIVQMPDGREAQAKRFFAKQ